MSSIILWAIAFLVILLCVTVLFLLFYSGLMYRIQFKAGKPPVGRLHVAYKFGRGEYSSVGELFTELNKMVPSTYRCFGMYYDDPEQVPTDKLRYIVGVILSEGDVEADMKLEDSMKFSGYKIYDFPEVSNMVYTTFPFSSFLSIIIAIQRVYPAFSNYIQENGLSAHPLFEIYDKDVIYFLSPLAKQNEFYVPETREKTNITTGTEDCIKSSDVNTDRKEDDVDEREGEEDASESSSTEESASSFEELDASHVSEENIAEYETAEVRTAEDGTAEDETAENGTADDGTAEDGTAEEGTTETNTA